jgi:outer membrane lipoprotein-sorting protein
MTTRRTLLAAGLAAALASPALTSPVWAQGSTAPVPAKLSAEQKALLDKATAYIQGLSSAKGRFVQTDQRGTQTQGTFYLQRPGKARFQYDSPAGLLVVSNGNNVNIVDSRLKTYESYPLSKTPLNLLLAREVRLDRGVVITDVRPLADGFTIVAQDAKRQALGRISIDFSNGPVALMGWTVTDIKGGQIRVRLADFAETANLDPKLFVLTDPRRKVGKP